MKKLALIMMFSVSGVVLSAEEYTIQTISAQKEASITPAFEKKVQKSALHSEKKKEGACNVVTVGKYPSAKAANIDLKKAKAISKDAFVRPLNRATPKVCESRSGATEQKAAAVQAKSPVVEHKEEKMATASVQNSVVKKEEPGVASAQEAAASPTVSAAAEIHATASVTPQDVKSEPCKAQPCTNVTYVYDRNLARKSDIEEAIDYYKRSPYYTFKPVLTQR